MATQEEIMRAAKQLFSIKILKDATEENIVSLLANFNRTASSKLVFWSKVWSHFRVNEQDMINLYRKQKQSTFKRVFDVMNHRLQTSNVKNKISAEEREILSDMEQLLCTDDLLLNSSHIILILRSMKYFKDKKNESSKQSSAGVISVDRHRYLSLHLMHLLKLRILLSSRALDDSLVESVHSVSQQLVAMAEKYKPVLDHDTMEKGRVETSQHLLSLVSARINANIAKSATIGSEEFWWCGDVRAIVEDMILVQRSAVLQKSGEASSQPILLPFPAESSELEKRDISQLLIMLVSGQTASATVTFDPRGDDDEAVPFLSEFFGETEFGGYLEELID
jgi:hypothetical protein